MNDRLRWIADVGECLLNTESGRSDLTAWLRGRVARSVHEVALK